MRYHYEKPTIYRSAYGKTYIFVIIPFIAAVRYIESMIGDLQLSSNDTIRVAKRLGGQR